MEKTKRSQLLIDVILLFAITALVYVVYFHYLEDILTYSNDPNNNILLRALFLSVLHFAQAGFALCIVMKFRSEKFINNGLGMKNVMPALAHSTVLTLVYIIVIALRGTWRLNYPFRPESVCNELISAQPVLIMIIGLFIFMISCGFFEAYNFAYVSRKINLLFPTKNVYLSPGPIIVSLIGFIAHAVVGINGWIGSLPLLFLIYGLMIVYEKTDNAWGCVLAFSVIWILI